ncbi:DegT/DnrJ/EryC1/StrS family aminotransferase [Actinocatenispora comari]|uniref:Aminotransferase DegT n=1 Tax=Actinocatenispora comari TaxID=2807577 RepID=A0A8J4ALJ6_9ACTN|nr:DegT/DnrJ/EryC1/StrS family aminotransferase [Actinocatenispora comari]GIL32022.1 aminotransferase DegT [Actinocatenispora comari]
MSKPHTLSEPASVNARPDLTESDYAAASAALRAGQFGHGAATDQFERSVAAHLGVDDVVAVSSGTAALQIALTVAGIHRGDEVIVPSMTYCASIHAILAGGARPRFIEVDPTTLCVTAETVVEALTTRTRAVMPVLYGGRAVDLAAIHQLLDARGISVVEDAAHAFGSSVGTRLVGTAGLLTCFSFGPIKNLTCIEGGAIVPRTPSEAAAARRLRALGIAASQAHRIATTTYTVDSAGLRATMSAVHAAVGCSQLERFARSAAHRRELWRTYRDQLHGLDGVKLIDVDVENSVPFNCVVRVHRGARDRLHTRMRDNGIGVGVHYPPNHLQPAFRRWHRPLPVTERVGREILSLPFHPAMTALDVEHVVCQLRGALDSEGSTR